MLRDRKALLEQELKRTQTDAAHMYLSLAIGGGDIHSKEYQDLKEKISSLQFDLNMVNQLIHQGHQ
jgi:putative IMPACT (imprinted ancient) family translation regulator